MSVDDAQTRKLLARYHAALERRDFAELSQMFAKDAVFLANGVASLKGRDAILGALREHFSQVEHLSPVENTVKKVSGGEAQSRWRIEVRDKATGDRFSQSGTETIWFDGSGKVIWVSIGND